MQALKHLAMLVNVCTVVALGFNRLLVQKRHFRSGSILFLNRVLFALDECSISIDDDVVVDLNSSDYRHFHLTNILKLNRDAKFRSGLLNVGITDSAFLVSEPLKTEFLQISLGKLSKLIPTKVPRIDLILAAPRPLRLERIVPAVSCLGIRHLAIIGASKVEKHYFGSAIMARPEAFRQKLIEGLVQAEVDCNLPTVSIHKSFLKFIRHELPFVFESFQSSASAPSYTNAVSAYKFDEDSISSEPSVDMLVNSQSIMSSKSKWNGNSSPLPSSSKSVVHIKAVLHPLYPTMTRVLSNGEIETLPQSFRLSELFSRILVEGSFESESPQLRYSGNNTSEDIKVIEWKPSTCSREIRLTLAIGPEGGWVFEELEAFVENGFHLVHMGDRIMRTDIAVQAALGIAHELIAQYEPI